MKLTKLFSHSYDEGGNVTRGYIRVFSNADIRKIYRYGNYLYRNKMFSELANFHEAVKAFGFLDRWNRREAFKNFVDKAFNGYLGAKAVVGKAKDNVKARFDQFGRNIVNKVDELNQDALRRELANELSRPENMAYLQGKGNKFLDAPEKLATRELDDMDKVGTENEGLNNMLAAARSVGKYASDDLNEKADRGTVEALKRHNDELRKIGARYRNPDSPEFQAEKTRKADTVGDMVGRAVKEGGRKLASNVKNKVSNIGGAISDKWSKVKSKFKK